MFLRLRRHCPCCRGTSLSSWEQFLQVVCSQPTARSRRLAACVEAASLLSSRFRLRTVSTGCLLLPHDPFAPVVHSPIFGPVMTARLRAVPYKYTPSHPTTSFHKSSSFFSHGPFLLAVVDFERLPPSRPLATDRRRPESQKYPAILSRRCSRTQCRMFWGGLRTERERERERDRHTTHRTLPCERCQAAWEHVSKQDNPLCPRIFFGDLNLSLLPQAGVLPAPMSLHRLNLQNTDKPSLLLSTASLLLLARLPHPTHQQQL